MPTDLVAKVSTDLDDLVSKTFVIVFSSPNCISTQSPDLCASHHYYFIFKCSMFCNNLFNVNAIKTPSQSSMSDC